MIKTAVVLGASGFLGRDLCELLSNHKMQLLLASRSGGQYKDIPIQKIDLTKENVLCQWLGQRPVDAIFYLSSVMPHEFDQNEFLALGQNIQMHHEVSRLWLNKQCRLVYASSGAVYGRVPLPWKEYGPADPESFYAVSKLIGEQVLGILGQKESLPFTALRIKAPYGYKQNNKTVVNIFMEKALAGTDLELFGRGQRKQDFIYTKDVALAFWQAYSKKKSGIYNVASGAVTTMKQLAQAVIKVTGSRSKIVFNGQPDPQEHLKVSVDLSRAYMDLNFKPKFSLEKGLKEMVAQYKRGGTSG